MSNCRVAFETAPEKIHYKIRFQISESYFLLVLLFQISSFFVFLSDYSHHIELSLSMIKSIGTISQIIGPVVDVYFDLDASKQEELPDIHDALLIKRKNGQILYAEVQQHIGENTVRTVASIQQTVYKEA